MALSRRSLAKTAVTLVTPAALAAPAGVALATGFIEVTFTPWGEQPGPDPTPLEAWALLALVYLVWSPLVMVGLVVALDRLGYRYTPVERERRPTARERRRLRAGLAYLRSREGAPAGAPRARPKRGASPPASGDVGPADPREDG